MAFQGFHEFGASEALCAQLGLAGFDRIADTIVHNGEWAFIVAVSNGTVADATIGAGCAVALGDAPAAGDVITNGQVIYGPFTAIQLSGGIVYAYRR